MPVPSYRRLPGLILRIVHDVVNRAIQRFADFGKNLYGDIFIPSEALYGIYADSCQFLQILFLHVTIQKDVPELFVADCHNPDPAFVQNG